ncbi:mitochondrial proton/calcium exchanger protein-like protein isoform X1 [Tanacetum coccineum]
MEEINNFKQDSDETLFQAWERFKELLMKCSQHYLTEMQEVILFYNGLDIPTRQILDSRGAIPTKTGRSTKNFDGLAAIQTQLNNLGREIKKVNEKVYAAQVGCEQCKGPYYTKDCPQKEEERRQSMEDTLSKFMSESVKRHEENSKLIKEIRAMTDAAIRNQGASIKTLEIQIGQRSKVLQERGFGSLPSSTETNLRDQVKLIYTTIEADSHSIRRVGSSQYVVSTGLNSTLLCKSRQTTVPFPSRLDNHYCEEEEGNYRPRFTKAYGASLINNTIPRKEKDPGFSLYLALLMMFVLAMPLLTVELANSTVKYPKGIAENVLVEIGKFTFPLDFIILDIPEDIKVPLILGRPFLSTAHAKIDVYKRNITLRVGEEKIIFNSVKPASSLIKRVYMLSLRERMELDLEARLMGETLVLNRSLDLFSKDYIKLNDLNKPFELRRNQGDELIPTIREGKVIEEFRTRDEDLDIGIDDYPILEDMDAYRDEEMGNIIVGKPFLREVRIKAKRFKGIITLYNGDDEVTYQMVRSHPRKLLGFLYLGGEKDDYLEQGKLDGNVFPLNLDNEHWVAASWNLDDYVLTVYDSLESPLNYKKIIDLLKTWKDFISKT